MIALGVGFGLHRGGAAAGGAAAFDWSQFFGVSDDGFVYDGTTSRFYQNSDGPQGVSPSICTTTGSDPVGWLEDVSGKGNHAVQSTSNNKPVFYKSGSTSHIKIGTFTNDRFMSIPDIADATTGLTIFAVWKNVSQGSNGTSVISNYNNGWTNGGYRRLQNAGGLAYFYWSSSVSLSQVTMAVGDTNIAVISRAGTGANQTTFSLYQTDGTADGSATSTQNGQLFSGMLIGQNGPPGDNKENRVVCLGGLNRDMTAEEKTTLLAELVTRFSGWTP